MFFRFQDRTILGTQESLAVCVHTGKPWADCLWQGYRLGHILNANQEKDWTEDSVIVRNLLLCLELGVKCAARLEHHIGHEKSDLSIQDQDGRLPSAGKYTQIYKGAPAPCAMIMMFHGLTN